MHFLKEKLTMKKVFLIALIIAVLLSCVNITAFAEDQNSKITTTLAEKLDKLTEKDKIETCIWLYFKRDADLIERETFKECGLTAGTCMTLEEVDIYSKTYNRIAGELEAKGNKALIERTGVPNEDIVFCSMASPLIILNLTKEQIYTISTFEEVQSLDYDNTVLVDEPSQSDLPYEPLDPIDPIWLEVVRQYYLNNSIMPEDINTEFRIPIGGNIYVVKFTVAGYDYPDVITETQIGEYTLRSNEPQPLILHAENKKLYTFEDAYQQEVINDMFLADISSFEGMVDLTKSVQPSTNETVPVEKKVNPVKVTVNKVTVNAKKLASKKQTVNSVTVKNAKGQIEVVKVKSGTTSKIYKKITVNKKTGAITFSKGKYAKKTYNIKLKITAKGNSKYKAKVITKTVTVKVK